MTQTPLNIAIAQLNCHTADIQQNTQKIIQAAQHARDHLHADLIAFPELAITGYCLEDLLYRQDIYLTTQAALKQIAQETQGITVIVGYPEAIGSNEDPLLIKRFNSLACLSEGKILAHYRKQELPNYGIFDEKRYFTPDHHPTVVTVKGHRIGLIICEDIWFPEAIAMAKNAGAELIICPNASPFTIGKMERRLITIRNRIKENGLPIVYINQIGGFDELLFDGRSMVFNSQGDIVKLLPHCQEAIDIIEINGLNSLSPQGVDLPLEKLVYEALVLGLRDYVHKNGFKGVLLGLSGGIDSSLTLAIAADALGKENITAFSLPSRYTSNLSLNLINQQIQLLPVTLEEISIEPAFDSVLSSLKGTFHNMPPDAAEENLQARIRGIMLMAISNKKGKLLLTTSNKSETAMGYATLYGDMAGGYSPLKDVYKTLIYKLVSYRNNLSPVIPQGIIDRAPTAELALNQKDQDSLPPYEALDTILDLYIEKLYSVEEIMQRGFDKAIIHQVIKNLHKNEYKRRQAAPGTRVTCRAFGKDWRYPMTARYPYIPSH